VTIQMEGLQQSFPVVLFVALYKVILHFESVVLSSDLCTILYTVVLTFYSVAEILKCDHSIEKSSAVLSCNSVYYTDQSNY